MKQQGCIPQYDDYIKKVAVYKAMKQRSSIPGCYYTHGIPDFYLLNRKKTSTEVKDVIYSGDALAVLRQLDSESVQCCVTSPPYFQLRDYGVDGQIGLEDTPEEFIAKLVEVFHEVKRVLKPDGTLWVNIADSYAGSGKGRNADGRHSDDGGKNTKQNTNTGSVDYSSFSVGSM